MKHSLKIDDLEFPDPVYYSERCMGNSLLINVRIPTSSDVARLNKMFACEGWYPVCPVGQNELRKMRVSKITKAGEGDVHYDIELTEEPRDYPFSEDSKQALVASRKLLRTIPQQANTWFLIISTMLVVTFLVGIGLIITAIVAAFSGSDILVSSIFAAAGGASLVTSFVTIPPLQLQKSRIDFSQWTMAFYSWWFSYLNTYEYFFSKGGHVSKIPFHEFKEINDYLFDLRDRTLQMMEETCEISPASFSLRKKKEK